MKYSVIHSSAKDVKSLISDIKIKFESIEFKPNLGIIILTQTLFDDRDLITRFLRDNINFNTLTFFVDGFGTEDGIFMHGILILLLQVEHKFFITGKGDIEKELHQIAEKIRDHDMALAVYPALYFPGKSSLLKGFIRDKYYWFRYRRCRNERCKKKILQRYSSWIQKERFFIPVNKVLRILGKAQIPVASVNLVPLEVHENTPVIYHNFQAIGRNVLVLAIDDAELHFKDIFPERGESYEETESILRNFFAFRDEVKIVKEGNVIGEINGHPVREYIKRRFELEIEENEFVEKVEKGDFSAITPYGLALISKKTYGASVVGLLASPLNLYPFYLNFDKFFDNGLVIGEIFSQKPHDFVDFGEKMMDNSLKIFFVDSTSLLAYRGETYEVFDFLSEKLKEKFLIIFTSLPSARLDDMPDKRFISEIEPGIYFFGSGTSLLLKFNLNS